MKSMKKKKMKLFDKFYIVWLIVTGILLISCILWYFLVERPNNIEDSEVAYYIEEVF